MSSIEEWAKARGQKPQLHPETAKNTKTPLPEPPKRPWYTYLPATWSPPIWLVSFVLVASLGAGGYYYGTTLSKVKIIEKPIEKIVYRTKTKVVKVPVEKIVYKTVEKPVERVVYKTKTITKKVPDKALQAKYEALTLDYLQLKEKSDHFAQIIDKFFQQPLNGGQKRKLIWTKRTDCPMERVSY